MGHHHYIHILLVEDSETDAYTVQRVLKNHMHSPYQLHHVECMTDAEVLLKDANRKDFNVILLDLGLPDTKDGKETLHRIEAIREDIPVVILTSVNDHDLAVELIGDGAEDFVKKSTIANEPQVICDAIDFAIQRHNNLTTLKDSTSKKIKEQEQVIGWMSGDYSAH